MVNINPINRISTCLSSIFLLIFLPTAPPPIPPATIRTSQSHSNSGTVFVNNVVVTLVICEIKIMYKLFCAATFVDIEKK